MVSRMGGSMPVSDWMKEGVETRAERVKRLERERVLDELIQRFESDFARIERERGTRAAWDIVDLRAAIKELRK
jgi:hypothetical protein